MMVSLMKVGHADDSEMKECHSDDSELDERGSCS